MDLLNIKVLIWKVNLLSKLYNSMFTPYHFDSYQTLRALENRLDKANLKLHEAEHINRTYLAIREQMIKDSLTFGNDLDALEADIEKQKQELKELQVMNNDAQVSRDAAKVSASRKNEKKMKEAYAGNFYKF